MTIYKSGTLCFWGDWFGRPMDNLHVPVSADLSLTGNILVIHFDNDQKCTVFAPDNIINEKRCFRIRNASKISWEWYRSKEHIEQNLCRSVYTMQADGTVLAEYSDGAGHRSRLIYPGDHSALELC